MSYDLAELERRLANVIRIGKIIEADYAAARVRVASLGLETDWLPFVAQRAGKDRTWQPPEVGEQVVVFSPSGDPAMGIVLPGLYQDAHPPAGDAATVHRTIYDDGTVIEYDRAAHRAVVNLAAGGSSLLKSGAIELELSPAGIDLRGPVRIAGTLDVTEAVTINASVAIEGNVAVEGNIDATGTIMDGGGNSSNHSH